MSVNARLYALSQGDRCDEDDVVDIIGRQFPDGLRHLNDLYRNDDDGQSDKVGESITPRGRECVRALQQGDWSTGVNR